MKDPQQLKETAEQLKQHNKQLNRHINQLVIDTAFASGLGIGLVLASMLYVDGRLLGNIWWEFGLHVALALWLTRRWFRYRKLMLDES